MQKTFKTLDEQIEILKSRGLIVDDYDRAKSILFRENYFFVNGYRHLLTKPNQPNQFVEGATFEELYSIFVFDRKVRNIIFQNILIVENNVKSIISYQMSKKYGYKEKDYLNPKHFVQESFKYSQVNDIINKMKRQIRLNGKQHRATKHYISNYGYIPMWVSVKVLSFGIMSELYSILKQSDKDEIAEIYGMNAKDLNIYLALLANYRNLCAHEDIVFNHKTEKVIPDTEYHKKMNIFKMDDEYIYGKNDIFSVFIMFKYLLEEDEFRLMLKEFEYEFEKLDGRIDSIPVEKILDTMGIPKNYMDIIEM